MRKTVPSVFQVSLGAVSHARLACSLKASLGAVSHAWLACSLSALCLASVSAFAAPNPSAAPAAGSPPAVSDTAGKRPAATGAPAVPAPVPAAPVPAAALDTSRPAAPSAAALPATADTGRTAPADTSRAAAPAPDSTAPAAPPAAAASPDSAATAAGAASDSAKAPARKKRKRVVRETTVNTIDELKGRYRSPKKALFMSLIVPGLGQAYVGQHWFNYTRGAAYLLTDVGLALGWRHYVVTKQDRQIAKYRRFADTAWRQDKYEDTVNAYKDKDEFPGRWEHRESYCAAVQSQVGTKGNTLYKACKDPEDDPAGYDEFRSIHDDAGLEADSVGALRAAFPNTHGFYELIGKEAEFIHGWLDSDNAQVDSTHYMLVDGKKVPATSPYQKRYIRMRAQANDYARMQAWFLGGMVMNHLVSALDAAFTAHLHNKSLYQTEVGFLDRFRLDSWVALDDAGAPVPTLSASYTF